MRRLAFALLLVAAPAYAATYLVSPAGAGDCVTTPCQFLSSTLAALNPTAGDIITFADGTYTDANSMLLLPHTTAINFKRVAAGGTMTAGAKTFAFTTTCGGVEGPLSPVTNFGAAGSGTVSPVSFSANDRVLLAGVVTSCVAPGLRSTATIYATKNQTFGAALGSGAFFKVGAGCQTPFNDGVTTSATCDPGPDSGWTNPGQLAWNGAAGNVLTIKATNRYKAYINGGGVSSTLYVQNQQYITFDGFKIANNNSTPSTAIANVSIGAHNITLQQMLLANAPINYNDSLISTNDNGNYTVNSNNVFDNIFAFGTARKLIIGISSFGPNTLKNSVLIFNGSQCLGPKEVGSLGYEAFNYLQKDNIAFWNPEAIPIAYRLQFNGCYVVYPSSVCCTPQASCGTNEAAYQMDQVYGMYTTNNLVDLITPPAANVYGAVGISRAGDHMASQFGEALLNSTTAGYNLTVKDAVMINNNAVTVPGFLMSACTGCPGPPYFANLTNATSISSVADVINAAWTKTNVVHLTSNANFTYDGSACDATHSCSNICTLHNDDGSLSATKRWDVTNPLWIAGYQFMIDLGYTPVDVHAEMAAAGGVIPVQCDPGGPTPTPTTTASQTPTPTFTNTNTPLPTNTPTLTPTPTFTVTPGGPTVTPLPTITPGGPCINAFLCSKGGPIFVAQPCNVPPSNTCSLVPTP